jgi:ornithine--oxo-acid transaminase
VAAHNSEYYIKLETKYGAHNYHPLPVVITRAKGVWVWDPEGRKYLDCLASYSAVNQGHRHPLIVRALKDQLGKVTLTSRAFHNDMLGPFLEKLSQVTGMGMALPMNTGAEAVETSIKLARKWGYKKKGVEKDKAEIIVCRDNFHGRTTTIVGFSTDPLARNEFGPFTPGFRIISFDDVRALEKAITKNTVGFLVEPIQAEAGVNIPSKGYLKSAREVCKEHNVLFMLDEIQTGCCRTGKFFAWQHENAKPDIMMLGKALGGGMFPVSVAVASEKIMSVIRPGEHGSTFGGNPLACAVAMASLDVLIDEKMDRRADALGRYFREGLLSIRSERIKEIRGMGLLNAIEVKKSAGTARKYTEQLMKRGVLAKDTHGQSIRFAPPLVITKREIDWMVGIIKEVLE